MDLLAVRGTRKSLLQHHSSKHQFFGVQPPLWFSSHLYITTEKSIALTIQTFVGKGVSLLFNMLSRLVIAFLPRSKRFIMAAVTIRSDFGAQENKSVTASTFSPSICHEVMELDAMILDLIP